MSNLFCYFLKKSLLYIQSVCSYRKQNCFPIEYILFRREMVCTKGYRQLEKMSRKSSRKRKKDCYITGCSIILNIMFTMFP